MFLSRSNAPRRSDPASGRVALVCIIVGRASAWSRSDEIAGPAGIHTGGSEG